jgi:ubiquinone/menaquinone biosynthesis C-methylase UbiE
MLRIAKQAPAYIYDIFISFFFTISAHLAIVNSMHLSSGNFLDVGCGTGTPLQKIIAPIKKLHQKIIGVDLHPQYAEKAMKLF